MFFLNIYDDFCCMLWRDHKCYILQFVFFLFCAIAAKSCIFVIQLQEFANIETLEPSSLCIFFFIKVYSRLVHLQFLILFLTLTNDSSKHGINLCSMIPYPDSQTIILTIPLCCSRSKLISVTLYVSPLLVKPCKLKLYRIEKTTRIPRCVSG